MNEKGPEAKNIQKVETHIRQQEKEYWAEFYAHHNFNEASSFFKFVNSESRLPSTVIDIGCGEGRDSFAFAHAGKRVVGLDRSEVGVEHANAQARDKSIDHLSFSVCDVANEQNLTDEINSVREDNKSLCFYLRFFLHSIPEETQEKLMRVISENAVPGDVFSAEFRTDGDEDLAKTFGNTHYRRYQNADTFSDTLQDTYGWSIAFEAEDQGLSPYGDEDPVLYRVLAIRP